MFHEDLLSKKSFTGTDGRQFEANYYVTSGLCHTQGAENQPVFGIRLELFVEGKLSDSAIVDDVSPEKEETVKLAKLFAENEVTPISLKDVVEDCISLQLK